MTQTFSTLTVYGCARCGKDHENLPTQPPEHPTYVICPSTGEKVWFRGTE